MVFIIHCWKKKNKINSIFLLSNDCDRNEITVTYMTYINIYVDNMIVRASIKMAINYYNVTKKRQFGE